MELQKTSYCVKNVRVQNEVTWTLVQVTSFSQLQ